MIPWEEMSAQERITTASRMLPSNHGMTSSFGIQSGALLHLVLSEFPRMPVFFIDTGYLFRETYRYADELISHFGIQNLVICRSAMSPAWQEARYGNRWEMGEQALAEYNRDQKLIPLEKEFQNHDISTWITGIRREQSSSRQSTPILSKTPENRFKLSPIADWTNEQIKEYQSSNKIPIHPLEHQGYTSVGDVHTTTKTQRFYGIKRECGLHGP